MRCLQIKVKWSGRTVNMRWYWRKSKEKKTTKKWSDHKRTHTHRADDDNSETLIDDCAPISATYIEVYRLVCLYFLLFALWNHCHGLTWTHCLCRCSCFSSPFFGRVSVNACMCNAFAFSNSSSHFAHSVSIVDISMGSLNRTTLQNGSRRRALTLWING